MARTLINKIAQKFFGEFSRLLLVDSQDNFLDNETVRQQLCEEHKIKVVRGSQLNLRIHFELEYKKVEDYTFVYLVDNVSDFVSDMRQECKEINFSICEFFPFFENKLLLRNQPLEVLEILYDGYAKQPIRGNQCIQIVENIKQEVDSNRETSVENLRRKLRDVDIDWNNQETIKSISKVITTAIEAEVIRELDCDICAINQNFQDWIDSSYFGGLQSSHIKRPRSVNKVLPHLNSAHAHNEKIALFVVDGISYWQYIILRGYLYEAGLKTDDGTTLSWLPSITKLSRQAIFRGSDPLMDYNQSPHYEKKLWFEYWEKLNFDKTEIQYTYDEEEFSIIGNVKRLAYVTTEMDENMHSSDSYEKLLHLTNFWSTKVVKVIKAILDGGFMIYLTTDHGSVLAKGWRTLKPTEKVFLYEDGSRGARHLIYNNMKELEDFIDKNGDISLLHHNNWLCMRENQCFGSKDKPMITHGGSHFMEVVIPFVKITR